MKIVLPSYLVTGCFIYLIVNVVNSSPVQLTKQNQLDQIKCNPDRIYKLDCNICNCTKAGRVGYCTLMGCDDVKCTPSKKWYKKGDKECFCFTARNNINQELCTAD